MDLNENKSLKDRVHVRYRPYNILKPPPECLEAQTQYDLEPKSYTPRFQEDAPQTSIQQRRVYGTGFKQRLQIKKELIHTSDHQINSSQLSNSKTSD